MKILLAMPTSFRRDGKLFQKKRRWIIPITLPYLAGLTPKTAEIHLVDEFHTPIDTSIDYDLVGLTVLCAAEKRAIEVAKAFRKRGIKVVAGGIHASLAPERLQDHVDSIIVGEAENIWAEVLADAQNGRLKPRYKAPELCDMVNLPRPRFDLLDMSKFLYNIYPIQTTRGCPHGCEFCEVQVLYGRKYRYRPIGEVLEEIKALPGRNLHIVDDNIGGNVNRAKELFRGMIPLKVKWSGLTTFKSIRDEEYVKLAKQSGCFHLNLGIESVNPVSLDGVKKHHNSVDEYRHLLRGLDRHRVAYSLNFILGFENDTPESVQHTIDFCRQVKPPMAFFSLLTPRPGTTLMADLTAQGRLLHTRFEEYEWDDPVFQPKNMTLEQLKEGPWKCYDDFYSFPQIMKRFFPGRFHLNEFFLNLFYMYAVRKRIDPVSCF